MSYHSFSKECQLDIFLDALCSTTIIWIEKGDGTISLYQRSVDEAYYFLEHMAEYAHQNWPCSKNKQGWGSNSNFIEPRFDTQLLDQFATLNEIFVQGIEVMRKIQEKSFTNAQCTVEESTHRVMKEIVFDDDYDLNGFKNQDWRMIQVVRIFHGNMSLLKRRYKSLQR